MMDSDCDSIPDMLSISDGDTQSKSKHSMPDLQSVTDSDCENLTLESQSIMDCDCNDSIPDLPSIMSIHCRRIRVAVMMVVYV